MNKKLIALAIAGAFAVPLAANADTSNVVIYGEMAVSVDNVDGGGGSTAAADSRGRVSSNQIFKLPNGVQAIAHIFSTLKTKEAVVAGNTGAALTA